MAESDADALREAPYLDAPRSDSPHAGHRNRLRERYAEVGERGFGDYELLEFALFYVKKRGDTKPLAKDLLKRFGSLEAVVNAPAARLEEVAGIGPRAVEFLHLLRDFSLRMRRRDAFEAQERQGDVTLGSWSAVTDYLHSALAFKGKEEFHVLFLDRKNRLIRDELLGVGTVDQTPVYPREVLKRALELSATAIILVHNHPSGDPTPSSADISMTKRLVELAGGMEITVHDHIIVGRERHFSMKGDGII